MLQLYVFFFILRICNSTARQEEKTKLQRRVRGNLFQKQSPQRITVVWRPIWCKKALADDNIQKAIRVRPVKV